MNDIEQRRALNAPATSEALQNARNIITNNAPANLLTYNPDEVTKKARKTVDAVDAANAAKNPPEDNWRQELEELDRRLVNQMTVDEAELYANNKANECKIAFKAVEGEIATLQDLLKTPGLSRCLNLREGRPPINGDRCDVCAFQRKLEAVTLKLQQVKAAKEKSIRVCGDIVRSAKELQPLRKRWMELKARDKKISDARRHIRNMKDVPLRQEHTTRGGFHFTKD
jgi:hypothetical protein